MKRLFLASYNGTLTTLEFSERKPSKESLKVVASTTACSPNPSWITIDARRRILFCNSNDRETFMGVLKSFSIEDDGTLKELCSLPTPVGAAYHTLHNDGNALAVAYYHTSCVGTYDVRDPHQIRKVQELTLSDFVPGPGKVQDRPRPHQTVIDPTRKFMVVPDLGADRIRVFKISERTDTLHQVREIEGLDLAKGSFPRHVAFLKLPDRTVFYVLNQDICSLVTFRVEYDVDGGLSFHKEGKVIDLLKRFDTVISVLPEDRVLASHLAISTDERFLLVSIRKDEPFQIHSPFEPEVNIPADSILSYRIDPENGGLSLAQESSSGGSIPRQFSLNQTGDKIAVVSQKNGWVSIFTRDMRTGALGELLGIKDEFGEMGPACIQWNAESVIPEIP